MEENIYLIIGLAVSIIVLFAPSAKGKMGKHISAKSELHSRDRYAVAEVIREESERNTFGTRIKGIFLNKYPAPDKQAPRKKGHGNTIFRKNHSV